MIQIKSYKENSAIRLPELLSNLFTDVKLSDNKCDHLRIVTDFLTSEQYSGGHKIEAFGTESNLCSYPEGLLLVLLICIKAQPERKPKH